MLAEATALLLASLTALTVAGPSSAPAVNRPAISAVSTAVATTGGSTAPSAAASSSATSAVGGLGTGIPTAIEPRGTALLDRLVSAASPRTAGSESSALNAAVTTPLDRAALRESMRTVLADPPAPRTVSNWWSALDGSEQLRAAIAAPELVGNLDGVPYAVRDQANRTVLRETIRDLELGLVGGTSRALQTRDDGQLQMLYSIADALGPAEANPQRQLITLDVEGAGKASIALGDLMTADYVSYLVPGMFISVGGNIVEWADTAARIYDEQVSWLALLDQSAATPEAVTALAPSSAATSPSAIAAAIRASDELALDEAIDDEGPTVATVAWIGYQTPHLLNVGSLDLAYEGRDAISSTLLGLDALRGADQPHVSLLAHSYGTTASMLALSETPARVDALAMIGSPGSPAETVDDLKVSGAVFVGEAAWDPISNSSFFGTDPGETAFGARVMSVAGSVDLITDKVLAGSTGHNEYFSPGTESMRNLALVGIGQADLVTDGTERDALRTLALARPGA
ncbi:alpha/beta hydrolase [Microcella flavibacter]|uniref:alpha/beta hydrolase n=1 Tax=Microcella flavibacter TaxID=1804990 RepID=UPI001E578429|nr:alpha/beta hydrolase [Microcella flavibacter]